MYIEYFTPNYLTKYWVVLGNSHSYMDCKYVFHSTVTR